MKDLSSLKNLPHYPVMLKEVLSLCVPQKGGQFIDCTFGSGGYTNAILSFPKTKVIALDRDLHTEEFVNSAKKNYKNRFIFYNQKFSELDKVIKDDTKVDCIIFDLGISSLQISDLSRGFSFNSKEKPDMRMGLNYLSAYEVINNFDLKTLNDILRIFGEEKDSLRIAKNIIRERKKKLISSIPELVAIIKKSKRREFKKKINIATKTFQAIRIFVNKEISELIEGLINATKLLKIGGTIIIVSFHSIEDKIIKFFFNNYSKNKSKGSRYYPDLDGEKNLFENYKNKVIKPSEEEINLNNRSRSAKLRFVTRSQNDFFYPNEFKEKFLHYLELENRYV
jgi:16S rRNA (cytosine1402-N4)-methyltransferase